MSEKHTGSCHCGAVRFAIHADLSKGASKCNCSICLKLGAIGGIVKPSDFTLVSGEDALSRYVWGHQISQRYFCNRCGVYCFARGHLDQLGGDYVSFNANCLEDIDPNALKIGHWDGRHDNWQAGMREEPWPITAA